LTAPQAAFSFLEARDGEFLDIRLKLQDLSSPFGKFGTALGTRSHPLSPPCRIV
jgi:hypothetical protein